MVKPELGTKRTCPSCGARFYDLLKNPIVCPKCAVSFIAATLLPSKGEMPAAPVPKPRDLADDDAIVPGDVELVSLEDVEEPGDDEAADIEGVDLGEEAADTAGEEETFLVEEEEEGNDKLSGLIEGGSAPGKEDEEGA